MAGMRVISADTLAGDEVYDPQGEKLGHIKDIMLDVDNGRIAYAVLSFGGVLGFGDKLFAIPWKALRIDHRRDCFVLDVDREKLQKARGFEKDNWPNFGDPRWNTQIYTHYGYPPYWS